MIDRPKRVESVPIARICWEIACVARPDKLRAALFRLRPRRGSALSSGRCVLAFNRGDERPLALRQQDDKNEGQLFSSLFLVVEISALGDHFIVFLFFFFF